MHRVFVPKLVYSAEWWEDRVVMMIVGLFGWKDRVPAVLRVFASAGFVSLTAGGRHQVYELKVAEARFRNQSLKRIVEAMLLKAHKIIPDVATFDTIYASARQVIYDAIQVHPACGCVDRVERCDIRDDLVRGPVRGTVGGRQEAKERFQSLLP
ncbi:hypothetical protein MVLG_01189 [Microbotryum lychnidis-dioicae p1A1 Lamole]|uniref:Uncharacterized protein n=1 Tax=Microbotryum lychnidis-dioicae (strain p1A1 Lamole / MvSl-1064) TaxID=683840 RepID=U5H1D2_USTV1|nr:hypothetical protein MVLG_01189 [Microbotryum lychnidis-dioicae p1A1 Lamole]|eukprot:KDE08735.1 hypothetical protein MVLG_01189 [Microbotryum lychnidis-dioicae p1A1 Lamole]